MSRDPAVLIYFDLNHTTTYYRAFENPVMPANPLDPAASRREQRKSLEMSPLSRRHGFSDSHSKAGLLRVQKFEGDEGNGDHARTDLPQHAEETCSLPGQPLDRPGEIDLHQVTASLDALIAKQRSGRKHTKPKEPKGTGPRTVGAKKPGGREAAESGIGRGKSKAVQKWMDDQVKDGGLSDEAVQEIPCWRSRQMDRRCRCAKCEGTF